MASWGGDATSAAPRLPALRRSALACTRCRQQKMKCSGDSPPCARCRKANSQCIYEPPPPPPPPPLPPPLPPPMHHPLMMMPTTAHCSTPSNMSAFSRRPLSPQICTTSSSHSAILAIHETPPGHGFGPSPPESAHETLSRKRRRVSVEPSADTDIDAHPAGFVSDIGDTPSPYQTVQAFESTFRQDSGNERGPIDARPSTMARDSFEDRPMFPQSATDRGPLLHYLCKAGLELSDAKEMFALFGERVGPFLPWLYDVDFTDLPNDPLYALAAIEVIARYLPGVSGLRAKLDSILLSLVQHVLFDDLSRSYDAVLGTMSGLAITYGYSKVGVARSKSRCNTERSKADVLSIKGIIEGYAVRWNIGRPHSPNVLGCVMWLWLYTMSNYYSLLLACPRTLSADERVHKAKSIVKDSTSHPQIIILLGEVDLCCITEPHNSAIANSSAPENVPQFDDWINVWGPLEGTATATARRLRFHFRFAKFYQHSRRSKPSSADAEVLGAARAFLHCMTQISPIAKGRIRYMCDFGFVMLVSACCYILKAVEPSRTELLDSSLQSASIQDVREVADLLQSLSSQEATTGAYGRALEGACDALSRCKPINPPRKGRPDVGEGQAVSSPRSAGDAFGHADGDGDMASAPAVFGDEQVSWFGSITDIPGGVLLDALSVPWQN
ncbi:hypothetical protein EDB81DRAFT_703932 [Dactylonectria macrodidyma]|uniref:Zn(2)-C6 fungal-type domain-containing protein n=1 Tax=Dactylonectria macrodidyma TaxID=307937 RepID=A0A9P9D2I3_9HYPO|nr:hypothetical protein EDB81DRAFT_703932 [Dactylonectria macrodidyma]